MNQPQPLAPLAARLDALTHYLQEVAARRIAAGEREEDVYAGRLKEVRA